MFSFKTRQGCKRLLGLFLIIILVFGFFGILFESDFGKTKIEHINVDFRGAKLTGALYYPMGTSSDDHLPAIIVAHGGANTFGVNKNYAQEFARRGFVVFAFSAYGQGYSEMPIKDATGFGEEVWSVDDTDAGFYDAYDYVKNISFVDETRIGIIGHSMGSYRADNLLKMTANYYTLNDIMINHLVDDFGVAVAENEIYQDASALAESKLSQDELTYYKSIFAAEEAAYKDKIKAFCVTGIDQAEINTVITTTVGGYEVQRCAKVNLGFIDGECDEFVFNFGTHDHEQQGWYSTVPMTADTWYNLNDETESNAVIGSFFTSSVASDTTLAEAIENRTARVFHVSPNEDHCKETISIKTNAAMIEFFSQTLGYNCGELSDPSTVPMDNYDSLIIGRIIANAITLFAFIGVVVALAGMLSHTEGSVVSVIELAESKKAHFSAAQYWIFAIVCFVAAGVIFWKGNYQWYAIAPPFFGHIAAPFVMPVSQPAKITFFFFLFTSIVNIIAMIIMAIWQKARGEKAGFAVLNINISIGKIFKYLLFAVFAVVVGYSINGMLTYLFAQDLRIWQASFSYIKADQWGLVLRLALVFLPMMFVSACAINYMVRDDRPEWLDTLIVVVINSAPIWILCVVDLLVLKYEPEFTGKFVCDFVCAYSFVSAIPIFTYLNRKLYKLTNSVWLGTFVCALLLAWLVVNVNGTGDNYAPQTVLNAFLGN